MENNTIFLTHVANVLKRYERSPAFKGLIACYIQFTEEFRNGKRTTYEFNGEKFTQTEINISEKPDVKNSEGYCQEMCGEWADVPEWTVKRLNFLEEMVEFREHEMCPLGTEKCPATMDYPEGSASCSTVKHCFPYLCDCSCGKCNTMYLFDDEIKAIQNLRRLKYALGEISK